MWVFLQIYCICQLSKTISKRLDALYWCNMLAMKDHARQTTYSASFCKCSCSHSDANDTLIWEIWHVCFLCAADNSVANYITILSDAEITRKIITDLIRLWLSSRRFLLMSIHRFRKDSAITVTDPHTAWREAFSLLPHIGKLYCSRKQNDVVPLWFRKHAWNNTEPDFVFLSNSPRRMYPSWAGICWQGCLETRAMPNLCVWLWICSLWWHHLWWPGVRLSQPRDPLRRMLSSLPADNTTAYKSKFSIWLLWCCQLWLIFFYIKNVSLSDPWQILGMGCLHYGSEFVHLPEFPELLPWAGCNGAKEWSIQTWWTFKHNFLSLESRTCFLVSN